MDKMKEWIKAAVLTIALLTPSYYVDSKIDHVQKELVVQQEKAIFLEYKMKKQEERLTNQQREINMLKIKPELGSEGYCYCEPNKGSKLYRKGDVIWCRSTTELCDKTSKQICETTYPETTCY